MQLIQNLLNSIFFIICLILLVSCSKLPNLGKKEVIYGNVEDRVSILKGDSSIFVDYAMENSEIKLPKIEYNDKWYSSNSYDNNTAQNLKLPNDFNIRTIQKIGKSSSKGQFQVSTPIIAKDKIFVSDSEGLISAYNISNIRKKVWQYKIDLDKGDLKYTNVGLSYSEGKVYIATGYNDIISLNAETGDVYWKRTINSIARSAPTYANGMLFVNTVGNMLYALDANDGAIIWKHSGVSEEISMYNSTSPIIHDNIVFVSYSSGELYALNLKTGDLIWYDNLLDTTEARSNSFSDINLTPTVVDDTIYVINNRGAMVAFDVYSGNRLWTTELAADKLPWLAGEYFFLINSNNELLCVNIFSGGVKWKNQLPQHIDEIKKQNEVKYNGPILANDKLLVVTAHGKLLSILPENGKTHSTTKILPDVYLPPVVANDTLFLLDVNAKLVSYQNDVNINSKSLTTLESKINNEAKKSFWPF